MQQLFRHLMLATAVLAVTGTSPALAGLSVDETRAVNKDATIRIENLAGTITVTGWDRSEVQITGTLDDQAEKLEITGGGDRLDIEVRYPRSVKTHDGSTLDIRVPAGCRVKTSTVSADVAVDKVAGSVEIETVSGEVNVRGNPAGLDVEAVSGGIDVAVATAKATLACVSGDINVGGIRGELECSTVSGSIEIDAGKQLQALECETVSGDLTVTGELPRDADWNLSAHSGDVTLVLAGKVDAEFRIETFSGEIHDAFGHTAVRSSQFTPGHELEFSEGEGNAAVEINAFSGDVQIRKN